MITKDWVDIQYQSAVTNISTNNIKIKQKEYLSDGEYPVIDQGSDLIGGYTNDESKVVNCNLPAIVFGDHTRIVKLLKQRFAPGADGIKILVPHDYYDPELFTYFTRVLINKIPNKGYARHFQFLKDASIPLPPLPEQRAIVGKIEQLFSDLDNGIANLTKAREQLKVYRQAVLKKAFEGELTREWREQQTNLPSAAKLLKQIKTEREKWIVEEIKNGNNEAKRLNNKLKKNEFLTPQGEAIPASWKWTSFLQACHLVVDCHNKTAPYEDEGIYLIRTSNVRNGKLDLKNKMKYISEETYKYWSRRCFPEAGDVLFTREAPMGEVAIVPLNTKLCLGQRMMLLRVFSDLLLPQYLLYNILSSTFQQRFLNSAIGTGVKHLRVGDVESLVIPICSIDEQNQIVSEIESRLSVCDNVEANIETALRQSEALRQSILKKAFAGDLLTEAELTACRNAPDYEPAATLLTRIKSEKNKIISKGSRKK
jgi:type I restriction enzyme, S subunit